MSSANLERAQQLLQQNRPAEAENFAREAISEAHEDALSHAILATALDEQRKSKQALESIHEAIRLSPDWHYAHLQLARIRFSLQQWSKSEEAIETALRLYPDDPDALALLAYLRMRVSRWEEALEIAERGLRVDPDHVACTNARAQSLSNLKRADQAADSLDYALQRDPENPLTHYQKGQVLLRQGQYDQATYHFGEALRLEPDFAEAREGLVEALKARHFIYSLFLKYAFFMAQLSPRARWAIIIGGLIGQNVLYRAFAGAGMLGAAYGVRIVYGAIVFFTWNASSIFNLLLFSHPMGRHALADPQKRSAALVGLATLVGVGFVGAFIGSGDPFYLNAAICSLLTTLPLSALERCSRPGRRQAVLAIAAGQALLVIAAFALNLSGQWQTADMLALIGIFLGAAFSWFSGFFTDE